MDRMDEQRLAAEQPQCLGHAGAETLAATCGGDEGGGAGLADASSLAGGVDAGAEQDLADRDVAKASDDVLVDAILALAQKLGLRTVAEGVETEAQRDILLEQGCQFGQGFLFGRPQPLPRGNRRHRATTH